MGFNAFSKNTNLFKLLLKITLMDICEKYLRDAQNALKNSFLSKRDPIGAVRSYEGAAQCFENARDFEKATRCYIETARLVLSMDPLKAAEMYEKAATCTARGGGSPGEHYLHAASIFKDHAINTYRKNPERGLQLLQKAAENFEKGGDRSASIQCYSVGAEASLKREDYLSAVIFYGTAAQNFERHKEYREAVKFYHKVARLWDVQNVPENVAENYWRMAVCLNALEEYEYSSQFFVKAAEKYQEAQETYKSAKSYEKAAEILEMQNEFLKAAHAYTKAAELVEILKNLDKLEEMYSKAAECYVKAGETRQAVEIHLQLTNTFADDSYRCSKHFEKAVSYAEDDSPLKVELLQKQGETLLQTNDFMKAAASFKQAAELLEELGESPAEFYKKAGDAYASFGKNMLQVKNQKKAREGFENAGSCYEKAGAPEEIEKIGAYLKLETGEREKQIREELKRVKEDFEKGLLPERYYIQIREGYRALLERLTQ